MSLIGALFGWSGKGVKEEPLCPLPVGGEPIKIDDDEQAIIDYEMHAWSQQEDSFNRQVLEIPGMDISRGHGEFLNDQRAENEMYHYIKGLKRAAYTRYSEGEYSSAAGTCFKGDSRYSLFRRQRWFGQIEDEYVDRFRTGHARRTVLGYPRWTGNGGLLLNLD